MTSDDSKRLFALLDRIVSLLERILDVVTHPHAFREACVKCGAIEWTTDRPPKCRACGHKLGDPV